MMAYSIIKKTWFHGYKTIKIFLKEYQLYHYIYDLKFEDIFDELILDHKTGNISSVCKFMSYNQGYKEYYKKMGN